MHPQTDGTAVVRVRPVKGQAVLFFSLGGDGSPSVPSLHGGASVRAHTLVPKWTAQIFKELPRSMLPQHLLQSLEENEQQEKENPYIQYIREAQLETLHEFISARRQQLIKSSSRI